MQSSGRWVPVYVASCAGQSHARPLRHVARSCFLALVVGTVTQSPKIGNDAHQSPQVLHRIPRPQREPWGAHGHPVMETGHPGRGSGHRVGEEGCWRGPRLVVWTLPLPPAISPESLHCEVGRQQGCDPSGMSPALWWPWGQVRVGEEGSCPVASEYAGTRDS